MNRLKSVLAATVLTFVLASTVGAGETLTPPCGETQLPPCSSTMTSNDSGVTGETPTPPSSESAFLSLIEFALESLVVF